MRAARAGSFAEMREPDSHVVSAECGHLHSYAHAGS